MVGDAKPAPVKPVIWFVVADSKQARIYTRKRVEKHIPLSDNAQHHHFDEMSGLELIPVGTVLYAELPEVYEKEQLGKVHESTGSAHHMNEPRMDIHDEIREHFAKAIATHLNTARAERQFNRLVLIAPPKLLGVLRAHLNKTVKMSVIAELSKDLTQCDNKTLAEHLENIAY